MKNSISFNLEGYDIQNYDDRKELIALILNFNYFVNVLHFIN